MFERRRTRRLVGIAWAIPLVLLGAEGCRAKPGGEAAGGGKGSAATVILAALARLEVKGRAPMTGYSRDAFGVAWSDNVDVPGGHNGCDTRNDVLRRDLTNVRIKSGTHGCTVAGGTLLDPYTATSIAFTRGGETSGAVQIDHVVALGDGWATGAQKLSTSQRADLANDPLNLWAVDGPTNQRKSDADAASWLPPNKPVRCLYAARQVAVKLSYHLWITPGEHDALGVLLSTCPSQTLPTENDWAVPALSG